MSTVYPKASRRIMTADSAAALLEACLAEQDTDQAETLLGKLVISHVEPLALRIASHRLRHHSTEHHNHIEDVASEAVVAFLLHVGDLRKGRVAPVGNLDAFVATLAARACNDYFRSAHPTWLAGVTRVPECGSVGWPPGKPQRIKDALPLPAWSGSRGWKWRR
jgi:DNA-directed RNA polymerase specialized sigma24 family protein